MTADEAREEFPIWAMAVMEKPVHIYDEPEWHEARDPEPPFRLPLPEKAREFWKKHMILIVLCICLPLGTLAACLITGSIVRRNTEAAVTDRLNHEWRGRMQTYLDEQDQQRMASQLLTGDASLQAQKEEDAQYLAKLASQYRTKRMKLSVMCNAWARMKSGLYPNTIKAVVSQPNQFQFWSDTNPVKADDKTLAMDLLDDLYAGLYPAGFGDEYIYGEWSENDYVLRNTWEKNSSTVYWRYPE